MITGESFGRTKFTELLIVSGKCFGIKLLSTYDFMICAKMMASLKSGLIAEGFDPKICPRISEEACIAAMCFRTVKGEKIFKNGSEALKALTPHELRLIYKEYTTLQSKTFRRDRIIGRIFNQVKSRKNTKLFKIKQKAITEFQKTV